MYTSLRSLVIVLLISLVATFSLTSIALANQSITSSGPLTRILITDQLNCGVSHTGDTSPEFFGDTACGTFLVAGAGGTGSQLFGPTSVPAGGSAAPRTSWTQVSQSAVLGAGTSADPFRVTTVADAGTTGLRVTETDSYVVGQEAYRTDVAISNSGNAAQNVIIYRAADCFLQNSDFGFGRVDAVTGAVACTTSQAADARIEQWFPITAGSHFFESGFNTVWARIGAKLPFPDTCACASNIDNGAGLSWSLIIPAGQSLTVSHFTTFSPLGLAPLSTTKTADAATAAGGASDGYTITIHNPNASAATLTSITDTLPAGFTYTAGSSTGVTTTNPGISGQTLTWAGPFSVPASGDVMLHFNVTVATTTGVYFNNAGGEAGAIPVAPTGPTAAITVTGSGAGTPAFLVLTPPAATNTVGTQHCVTATVTDANAHPTPGITVDFSVSGANAPADASAPTDSSGQASSCYTGTATGTDTTNAFADTNSNGVKDTGEPSDTATKTWTAGAPATLALSPKTDTNTAGSQHCVTATVKDSFANPTPGITVDFSVSGANAPADASAPTDSSGQASSCYTGTATGTDTISAFADTNRNGVKDAGEPSDTATKLWTAGAPATLTLTPSSDTNTVGAEHCVTATVVDSFHNPTPGITVRFAVSGSVTTSGTGTAPTDANGRATFCYTGPALPGSDVITAYADTNNNGVQDPGEPSGRATKEWVLAQSTPGCKVTGGGRITAANGDKATFGGNASASGTPSGNQEYQDHGPAADLNVHSTAVLAVVCSGNTASVFGTATIDGSGSFTYRIDLTDVTEPGADADKYRIRLSTGYDSGERTLTGGNIQLH